MGGLNWMIPRRAVNLADAQFSAPFIKDRLTAVLKTYADETKGPLTVTWSSNVPRCSPKHFDLLCELGVNLLDSQIHGANNSFGKRIWNIWKAHAADRFRRFCMLLKIVWRTLHHAMKWKMCRISFYCTIWNPYYSLLMPVQGDREIRLFIGFIFETDCIIAETKAREAQWKGEKYRHSRERAVLSSSNHNLQA